MSPISASSNWGSGILSAPEFTRACWSGYDPSSSYLYNTHSGENRPVRWTKGNTVITMSYDRMGRRVTKNNQRFVYDGYLQIAEYTTAIPNSSFLLRNSYVWDPTEKIATRPLAWNSSTSQPSTSQPSTSQLLFYTHDGNKNVSEVIASDGTLAAHYEYAPFGALTVSRGTSAASNPWRFSSEYAEDDTATVYYNYRHYEPLAGRWLQRDPIFEDGGPGLYVMVDNFVVNQTDKWGLYMGQNCTPNDGEMIEFKELKRKEYATATAIPVENGNYAAGKVNLGDLKIDACCKCKQGRFQILLSVKSTYYISIIVYGNNGPKDRTNEGYKRTLRHEKLHVAHMTTAFNKVVAMLKDDGLYSHSECLKKRKDVVSGEKNKKAVAEWEDMKQKDYVHSGSDWDDWRKNDGKTETDPELW